MHVVTTAELAEHLNLPSLTEVADGAMLDRLAAAAQGYVETHLGFTFADRFDEHPPPEPLVQAILTLAAHWYEHREAASPERAYAVPFGVEEIISAYREWSF